MVTLLSDVLLCVALLSVVFVPQLVNKITEARAEKIVIVALDDFIKPILLILIYQNYSAFIKTFQDICLNVGEK